MGNLGLARERLKEYLDYLGLSYAKLEEFYGLPASTWEYNAKKARNISDEILGVLRGKEPPLGKFPPNEAWLVGGVGAMILPVKEVPPGTVGVSQVRGPTFADLLAEATASAESRAQAMDYGREAARIVLTALRVHKLEGADRETEDWLIDQFADGLAAGRPRQQLEERLALALQLIRGRKKDKGDE